MVVEGEAVAAEVVEVEVVAEEVAEAEVVEEEVAVLRLTAYCRQWSHLKQGHGV